MFKPETGDFSVDISKLPIVNAPNSELFLKEILKRAPEREVGCYIKVQGEVDKERNKYNSKAYFYVIYIIITEIKRGEPLWSIMSMLEFKTYEEANSVKELG